MTSFVMNIFQEFLGALFGRQVEVEKRDAPEDEKSKAREEVEIKVSLFLLFSSYHHFSLFLDQTFFIATLSFLSSMC